VITVVYYTSNREQESFEQKIRQRLLDVIGDIPLVSVSQKPIDFGDNICVGDIGVSDENIFRQLLAGCERATTPLIATAEADCLYPPTGYFDFRPDNMDMAYRYTNLWILKYSWPHYRKKAYSLCALVSGREYLIQSIKRRLKNPKQKGIFYKRQGWQPFENAIACINIKTVDGMRRFVGTEKDVEPQESLPYWGSTKALKAELFR
jgi:hypothetical protein